MREAVRAAPADGEPWFALLAPDVAFEIREIGRPDLPDAVHGVDGVRDFFRTWTGAFQDWTPHAEEIVDCGDRLVVGIAQRGRGRVSGVDVQNRHHELWSLREDGLAEEIRIFRSRDAALEAAGPGTGSGADLAWRLTEALNRWDADAWIALAHPDMVLSATVLAQVENATFEGHDGIRDYMRELEEGLGRPRYEAEEILESAGSVYGRARIAASGPRSGATLEVTVGMVSTIRDGLIGRIDAYADPDEGLRAFGIEP
jgi:ketosteroid isomerase-like protein